MKNIVDHFQPLPGHVLIKMEALYRHTGPITIPERYQKAPHVVGRIWKVNMLDEDRKFQGHEFEEGDQVIVPHHVGRRLLEDFWIYPASEILALCTQALALSPHEEEIPRCRWCGAARENTDQTMLLDDRATCPRCNKNYQGEAVAVEVTASDEETHEFFEDVDRYQESLARLKKGGY